MKNIMKKLTSFALAAAIFAFPGAGAYQAFAETGEERLEAAAAEEKEAAKNDEVKLIESIAEALEIYSRYASVDKGYLYEEALKKLIQDNPELYEQALSGMLSSVDEHSVYYTKEEKKKLFDDLSDEIVGIGVTVLLRDGKLIVSQPIPGSPAEAAGIRVGDIIVSADGVDLSGMDLDTAVSHVRGKEGTEVSLKIWRSSVNGYIDLKIKREKVVSNPVEYELKETADGEKVMWIRLLSFSENSAKYFKEALDAADKEKTKNIIIDVRNNGGGYLSEAVKIADEFLPDGAIITSEDHKLPLLNKVYRATGADTDYNVVMLVNSISASASEVLTAALSENKKAKVIGENTFGKGTVQSIAELNNGGVMKYTSAYYLTPLGHNINKVGIKPDAVVENSFNPVDMSQFGEFNYSKIFTVGDKDPQVETAKKMLDYLGIFVGDINDTYDENLKAAVNTFQSLKPELFPYGELDRTTQLSLYQTTSEMKEENDDQLEAALAAF